MTILIINWWVGLAKKMTSVHATMGGLCRISSIFYLWPMRTGDGCY